MVISKKKNFDLIKKIEKIIPGGAHTYSRGSDQFSENVPQMFNCWTDFAKFSHQIYV